MAGDFSVVAIIAAYNEEDIIEHAVKALIDEGVDVYLLDDGSTDRTVSIVEPYVGKGVRAIERLEVDSGHSGGFQWERILRRKEQLAAELAARWFIHHDADEFRESPWTHLTLKDAIRQVDAFGFNAIDFACFDFWPTHDRIRIGDDVRKAFTRYGEEAPYNRLQIRCWKKTADVDLASSGGHEAQFHGRNVFPVRFILRHYPIRGQQHGERKVFNERRHRFLAHERARGWHVQYDHLRQGMSFIRDHETLTPYDPDAVRVALTLRHRGVEALEAALGESQSREEMQRHEFDELRNGFFRLRTELGIRDATLNDRQTEIARLNDDLLATNAELGVRTDDNGHLRAALVARRSEADGLRQALEERDLEIQRWRTALANYERWLDGMHRSWSWRLTSPLRAIAHMFRRRRP